MVVLIRVTALLDPTNFDLRLSMGSYFVMVVFNWGFVGWMRHSLLELRLG